MTERPVLIVDDDDEFRQMLELVVAARGYQTLAASDGVDALTMIEQGVCPSLILLDLRMPRLNGIEFLHALDAKQLLHTIPVVVLTGDANATGDATRAGATAVLCKPVDASALVHAIEHTIA